jgi:hypothetical protein
MRLKEWNEGGVRMSNFVSGLFATFVTVPIAAFMLVYMLGRKVLKRKKKSFHLAMNVSTVFFILGVHFLILAIWGTSYLWMIIIFLLLLKVLFMIGYWRKKHDVHLAPVFRLFWRFNFLFFSFAYFSLLIYGLIMRTIENL